MLVENDEASDDGTEPTAPIFDALPVVAHRPECADFAELTGRATDGLYAVVVDQLFQLAFEFAFIIGQYIHLHPIAREDALHGFRWQENVAAIIQSDKAEAALAATHFALALIFIIFNVF